METYLTGVSQKEIKENKDIQALFESSFQLCDIAISSQDAFLDELSKRFFMNMMEHEFQGIKEAYQGEYAFLDEKEADRAVMRDKLSKNELGSALSPDSILFLNFNYTNTLEKLYLEQTSALHIHIHGELNSEENPIIFGYGDEMDAKYKELEDMNDNTCLTNMKSINYLGTDKYRQLLMFMQQGLYQVFVMGHSCGNSDRTLLNTLFEHKNCISIKPFYHEQEPGKDNYNDMVKNISRCFKDAASMRDRVVNRNFCTTLPQSMTLKQD